jgi:hypothetical protein
MPVMAFSVFARRFSCLFLDLKSDNRLFLHLLSHSQRYLRAFRLLRYRHGFCAADSLDPGLRIVRGEPAKIIFTKKAIP